MLIVRIISRNIYMVLAATTRFCQMIEVNLFFFLGMLQTLIQVKSKLSSSINSISTSFSSLPVAQDALGDISHATIFKKPHTIHTRNLNFQIRQ